MCERKRKNNKNGESNLQSFFISHYIRHLHKCTQVKEQSSCLIIIELKDIKFICVQCPK